MFLDFENTIEYTRNLVYSVALSNVPTLGGLTYQVYTKNIKYIYEVINAYVGILHICLSTILI